MISVNIRVREKHFAVHAWGQSDKGNRREVLQYKIRIRTYVDMNRVNGHIHRGRWKERERQLGRMGKGNPRKRGLQLHKMKLLLYDIS